MITMFRDDFADAALYGSDTSIEPHTYAFGPFMLDVRRRVLTKGTEVRALPEKLFQMLLLLLNANGRIVSREAFLSSVWPEGEVTDANLKQHMFMLRGVLGEHAGDNRYVVTVPREGYRLALSIERKTGLVMKHVCERCQCVLAAEGAANICSYECTYCVACAEALHHICQNCSGELVMRPKRGNAFTPRDQSIA